MFYAANIPVEDFPGKAVKFRGKMKYCIENHTRPHLVYGTTESTSSSPPLMLPPLKNNYFEELDPRKGSITNIEDMEAILRHLDALLPLLKVDDVGWKGTLDANGKYTGPGVINYQNGSQYEGDMKEGKFHGVGTFKYATGNIYTGSWAMNKMDGQGVLLYANGDRYEGSFSKDLKSGQGKYEYATGDIYTGHYSKGIYN
jgi:hypothetical protein